MVKAAQREQTLRYFISLGCAVGAIGFALSACLLWPDSRPEASIGLLTLGMVCAATAMLQYNEARLIK